MQALPHDVMEKVGNLTRLQLPLGVTASVWDIATQLTEQDLAEWGNRMGFALQFRTVQWTVILHGHHHDLAVRLGSIAKIRVKPMFAQAQRDISINTSDAAKLIGRVNKVFVWHKSPLIRRIYMDIDFLQFMKARRFKSLIHLE